MMGVCAKIILIVHFNLSCIMKYFLLLLVVIGLSSCQTMNVNEDYNQGYTPYNSQLTYTTYLGPLPSIRPPDTMKPK